MKMLELFSGSGEIARTFEQNAFKTYTVDIRRRKGVCEPDLKADVRNLQPEDLPGYDPREPYQVVWIGLPCDVWSYAAGSFHWNKDGIPKTQKCRSHIELLLHVLRLIDALSPEYFIFENPRGKLRFFRPFRQWLEENEGIEYTITLDAYGFPTTKPTNIFTNIDNWITRPLSAWGRGAKCSANWRNMTTVQRQSTPPQLAQELIHIIKANYEATGRL